MRILQRFLSILTLILLVVTGVSLPAEAGSSSAIRTYNDVIVQTKDFAGQDLGQAEFTSNKLEQANFSDANLRGAVFNGVTLTEANWHGVDFTDGIAYLTDFTGADLTDAVLTSALMLKSTFRKAKITGADFSFAVLEREQVAALCEVAEGVNPVTGVETRESLECP